MAIIIYKVFFIFAAILTTTSNIMKKNNSLKSTYKKELLQKDDTQEFNITNQAPANSGTTTTKPFKKVLAFDVNKSVTVGTLKTEISFPFFIESFKQKYNSKIENNDVSKPVRVKQCEFPEVQNSITSNDKLVSHKNVVLKPSETTAILPKVSNNEIVCKGETIIMNGKQLSWETAKVGTLYKSNQFCLQSNYKPITRKCVKNGTTAQWTTMNGFCAEFIQLSNLTQNLEFLKETNLTAVQRSKGLRVISKSAINLPMKPVDIDIMSEVLQLTALSCPHDYSFLYSVNYIMRFNKTLLKDSQNELNSTDKVLCALDHFLVANNGCDFQDTHLIVKKLRIENNTIGLMLRRNASSDFTDFRGYYFTLLNKHYYWKQLKKTDFELAIIIPEDIFLTAEKLVILSLFYDDSLFNTDVKFNVTSWIINVLITDQFEMKVPIKIFHKFSENQTVYDCVHWNYGYYTNDDININGNWSINNSTIIIDNKFQVCEYYHLTHFAVLITNRLILNSVNSKILQVLSTAGLLFSMCGLLVIFFIAVTYKQFRCIPNNQIGISISFSLFLQIVLIFLSDFIKDGLFCIIFGALLHYSVLTGYFWMLIISYSSYRRLVVVFYKHIKNMFIKYSVCAWGVPVIPIICILAVSPEAYMKGYSGICYPEGIYMYLGVVFPIAIILTINVIIFVMIIFNLTSKQRRLNSSNAKSINTFSIIKSTVILFFLMGLNWMFGVFVAFDFNIVFVYLFTVTATLQGFIIFIYFIFCFKTNREMWMLTLNRKLGKFRNKSKSIISNKTEQCSQISQ